ncbi:tyrosine decarboxylase-like [Neocloeon triangulifer]|uniref:tyrosine decarboxylase-like n=1 Tax=Neocloeon triangulifer TaxID=2078957 RepID=UPI00286F93F5|nr:tyrosine decarboxylase-like [Neocloeon triangulifer]
MNVEEFRENGKAMIDYICEYASGIGERRVTPAIEPGYLRPLLPDAAPQKPEKWCDIMADIETKIMPGVTHWQHPRFHAYFPSGNSFPSILGDMLSDAIGCIGFSWAASPSCAELETIVLDWLGQAIGLPEEFLSKTPGGKGGGVIQSCASECILVSMLAARAQALNKLKEEHPGVEEGELLSQLVAYCSKEAHSCVEKAAKICLVKLRILEPDSSCSLRGATVAAAIEEDRDEGLMPFFVSTTLGTTSCCSFDNISEIGPICADLDIWMHVDGAYAGNAFICEEFRPLMKGIELASSFNTNPNKWLLTNFDCSTMWVRDQFKLTQALVVDPLYLQHSYSAQTIDYRHWGIPLSRRFRALKLWFVIRSYGIEGLQRYIRNHCRLAKRFEQSVLSDNRFEVLNDVKMGLVCFRLRGDDKLTQDLLAKINISGQLHMIPARVNEKYIIRFCVTAEHASENDIDFAWKVVKEMASEVTKIPEDSKRRQARLSKRFSFTRSVSRDLFQRSQSRTSLSDGVSPLIVLDENNTEVKDDVFTFAPMKDQLAEEIKAV